jgi:hypothetical protein
VNLWANESPELKATYLPKLASGQWAGTMCLTEPQAGTDLGLLRTRAEPQADGSYRLTGSKIFISGGEHDLTENIVHLVLARLPDAPSRVKGISVFLVRKVVPSADDTLGRRNAVVCGSIEHKMGIYGNSTCTMSFDGATGRRRDAGTLLALLTPVVKAMASDTALESTLTAMQVLGGHGYVRDNGVEQHVRDVRIIGLYEGTNGVQAMDLLGRQVVADGGLRMAGFIEQVSSHAQAQRDQPGLQEFAAPVVELAQRVAAVTSKLVESTGDVHAAGAASVPYLRLAGNPALSHVWLRAVQVALPKSASGDPFYASKVATARFYLRWVMRQCLALCEEIRAGAAAVMDRSIMLSTP